MGPPSYGQTYDRICVSTQLWLVRRLQWTQAHLFQLQRISHIVYWCTYGVCAKFICISVT